MTIVDIYINIYRPDTAMKPPIQNNVTSNPSHEFRYLIESHFFLSTVQYFQSISTIDLGLYSVTSVEVCHGLTNCDGRGRLMPDYGEASRPPVTFFHFLRFLSLSLSAFLPLFCFTSTQPPPSSSPPFSYCSVGII